MRTTPCTLLLTVVLALDLHAGDWPMWKHNAGRTAASPDALPAELHLQWVQKLPRPRQAWRDKSNSMLFFDASYEPIVADKLIFVGSMNTDSVTAYDTDTGTEKWRFYTDGPVRFAPVAYRNNLYVGSDDGHLYCLTATTGELVWKLRGGPSDHRVLGNGRLIGMWPFRGAPVIHNDVLYCAAGIWPFMGTFIYALDPDTGKPIWTNSGNGSRWITQQHGAPSFAGVAPQGYLASTEDILLIPSGRSVPGAFNAKTGAFLYNHASSRERGKDAGGYAVSIAGKTFACRPGLYDLTTGKEIGWAASGVITPTAFYTTQGSELKAIPLNGAQTAASGTIAGEVGQAFIKAGDSLYCARNDGTVSAVNIADTNSIPITWQGKVDGKVWNMLAANDRLFVVGMDGSISCFGADERVPVRYSSQASAALEEAEKWSRAADAVINRSGTNGYCVALGLGSGALITELLRKSELHVIVVDADETAVDEFRRRMDRAGLYGTRVAAIVADPSDSGLPPYLASAVVSEELTRFGSDDLAELFRLLRPYGGTAFLPLKRNELSRLVRKAGLQNANVDRTGKLTMLMRTGALSGSAFWSHQYADAANSVVSKDKLVKPPFGLLWFGGPTNDEILPRHGHGPNPEVAGGRVFIEGANILRALDAYTGRRLWERRLDGVGHYYNNTDHHPGANEIGSNYASTEDSVYIILKEKCLKLDAASGATTKEFVLPTEDDGTAPNWGSLRIEGDFLVATATPLAIPIRGDKVTITNAPYASASKTLTVLERHTGKLMWTREATHGFRHNSVIAAGDRVFCLDKLSPIKEAYLQRRGQLPPTNAVLLAMDIQTGDVIWQSREDIFGTWLGYSAECDVVVQCGSAFRDRASDDVGKGMIAYRAKDGHVLWKDLKRSYAGPLMLRHGELIINGNGGEALDLLTGKPTGWKWGRYYGCNTAIGGEHVLTFRSGAAGYYDVTHKGGTGNLGGFKSGCTSNLIPGDGLLIAPDYTRTCSCSYQNQTSLALIHMPEAEMWTFSAMDTPDKLGINFGAPGDRVSETGTLWSEFPEAGSPAASRTVTAEGTAFRHHSSLFSGPAESWVASSGIEGMSNINIKVPTNGAYTVRLYFAEPNLDAKSGSRVFNVSLGDKRMLTDFDIVSETGSPRTSLVKEQAHVELSTNLVVSFSEIAGRALICGVEILSEE